MPAHVIYGDSFLAAQSLKALEGGTPLLEANHHRLRGGQARPGDLLELCQAMPFLDNRRLVVVEGLLTTFEGSPGRSGAGRSRSRRPDAAPTHDGLRGWETLAQAIPHMPETTVLALVDGPLAESNPLLSALRPVSQVQRLAAPSGEALARWIKSAAQEKGAGINPPAIRSLMDLVGSDLWTLDRELEKLALYAAGKGGAANVPSIDESDVQQLVSQVREASIFNAVDAILEGKPAVALRLVQQLQQDGRDPSYIIAMVERQLRLLALARHLSEQGVAQGEMAGRLGVASQFAVNKTLEQSRRHSWLDIYWRFHRLLDADLAIKTGRQTPDLALELLVADLAGRGRR
ncbi:MAG: DNA polymerase III subunit delta [SAR202 cluster bacterium]|nr:DNA polymerase III subunit delta [SAR202 cluster bacterium]